MEIDSRHSSEPAESSRRAAIRNDARETLSQASDSEREPVKETVLEALYRHHPDVGLEDILELNALIPAPKDGPATEQIDAVLASVSERPDISPLNRTEPAPKAEKVTAGHRGTR